MSGTTGSRIAVIVDTYNSAAFLALTLGSITAQTRLPDAVLIVDDNSSDGSREIAAAWAAQQPFPVQVLHNADGPPGSGTLSVSMALQAVTADLVATLDGDDALAPEHLATLERMLDQMSGVDLVFGDATLFRDDPLRPHGRFGSARHLRDAHAVEVTPGTWRADRAAGTRLLLSGCSIPSCANMFRREAALRLGGIDLDVGHAWDYALYLKLAIAGDIAWTREALGLRREHAAAVTAAADVSVIWPTLLVLAKVFLQRDRLQLSAANQRLLAERLQVALYDVVYWSSRSGPRELWRVWRALGEPTLQWRDLARAAASIGAAPLRALPMPAFLSALPSALRAARSRTSGMDRRRTPIALPPVR